MVKLVCRTFFLCVVMAIALVSVSDATLARSRNEDVTSSVALSVGTKTKRQLSITAVNATVTIVAGNLTTGSYYGGYSGDGGPATLAHLHYPLDVAVGVKGNIYIADTFNNVIRMVNGVTGIITTVAGNLTTGSYYGGYSGDGGPATLATLYGPTGVAVDVKGNIYIADSGNNVIRMVNGVTGIITTVAGNLTSGSIVSVGLSNSGGYSGDGGPATLATLNQPESVAVDLQGNIYISDTYNGVIRMVTKCTGYITTVAGNSTKNGGYSGDGGPATLAQLYYPNGVAVDVQGNIYIADTSNGVIRMVTKSTGIITTLATSVLFPYGIAIDIEGHVYTANPLAQTIQMIALTAPTSMPTTAPTFTPTILPASVCTMPPPRSPRTAKKCTNLRKSMTQSKCKMQNA